MHNDEDEQRDYTTRVSGFAKRFVTTVTGQVCLLCCRSQSYDQHRTPKINYLCCKYCMSVCHLYLAYSPYSCLRSINPDHLSQLKILGENWIVWGRIGNQQCVYTSCPDQKVRQTTIQPSIMVGSDPLWECDRSLY